MIICFNVYSQVSDPIEKLNPISKKELSEKEAKQLKKELKKAEKAQKKGKRDKNGLKKKLRPNRKIKLNIIKRPESSKPLKKNLIS